MEKYRASRRRMAWRAVRPALAKDSAMTGHLAPDEAIRASPRPYIGKPQLTLRSTNLSRPAHLRSSHMNIGYTPESFGPIILLGFAALWK
jgi:hypothetical protein